MKNQALKAVISAAVFTAALFGGTDSPIPLSEKAMAHLRAPSGSMPDEIKREISEVLRRHFGGAVAAVMGGEADSQIRCRHHPGIRVRRSGFSDKSPGNLQQHEKPRWGRVPGGRLTVHHVPYQ